jgi:splicing factor 3B subunit 4
MHGQYLTNKEISVQYAYKKDGKGERHGDEAERMLAAQARKHNVQPQTQPLPPSHMMGQGPGMMPGNVVNGDGARPMPSGGPPDFAAGRGPIPMQAAQQPPRPGPPAQALSTPHPGLPARPPPSQVGFGGHPPPPPPPPPPQGFLPPPGFNNAPQQSFSPQPPAPAGFAPPAGFGGPSQGAPPPLPPGFQPPGYARAR